MSVCQMREYVRNAYQGDRWQAKVAKMADNQIIAIYFRLIEARRKP